MSCTGFSPPRTPRILRPSLVSREPSGSSMPRTVTSLEVGFSSRRRIIGPHALLQGFCSPLLFSTRVLPRPRVAVVPPAVPLVDAVLPGASLFGLLLSLESAVFQEPSPAHHDHLLVLLLHSEQGFELVLVRQGRTGACSWSSCHWPLRKYVLEVVSWDSLHLDGHWSTLPRTGMCSEVSTRQWLFGVSLRVDISSLVLLKLVVSLATTTVQCSSTTAALRSACA